jgi:hypothetical protein
MSSSLWSKAFIAGCGLSIALSAAACNTDQTAEVDRDTDRLAADTSNRGGHEGAPITLTGCLQRGSGLNNYILTRVNAPSETPVATSGGDVQREQLRAAKHAYVLDGDDNDSMRTLVGKQVRVTGTLDETSELRRGATEGKNTSGRRDGLDIDSGDLAKVAVQGIVQVADVCGEK